tara:strand:- start:329 stop:487 length:159 start_codon:yes stop_codon:yes gene_type:complete
LVVVVLVVVISKVVEVVPVHIELAQHQLEHIQYQHQFRLVLVVKVIQLLLKQ